MAKPKKTKFTEEVKPKKEETKTPAVKAEKTKHGLSIEETKLGVTMVLTKGDCKALGINGNTMTGAAIKEVRAKLGLPERAIRE